MPIDVETPVRSQRAAALPADERRAAIIAATLPLLMEHGTGVTTRMIAEASGIAEGTIFRVFADMDSVIAAVVESVFDPAPLEAAIAAIDSELPFEDQLALAVELVQERLNKIWRLVHTAGVGKVQPPRRSPDVRALAELFAPVHEQLAYPPHVAARMLRGITLAMSHPALAPDDPMTPREIVSLLLDGVRVGGRSC
jgi:AcrR family transcriptional regulator